MSSKPRKRKMKRTDTFIRNQYEKTYGEKMGETIKRLNKVIDRRDKRIESLRDQIKELNLQEGKKARSVEVKLNREIRKRETIIRNLKKKHEDFRGRTMKKARSIIYKTRYKEYEPDKEVVRLEERIEDASKVHVQDREIYEVMMKSNRFVEEYNEINGTRLDILSYLILLSLSFFNNPRGVMATTIQIKGQSPHKIRTGLNRLSKTGLVKKKSVWYRITFLGETFLKDVRNLISYGNSEVINLIKETENKND